MTRVVLLSCPVRGRLYSKQRRADIQAVRSLVKLLEAEHKNIIFSVPYLLYAEVTEELVAARSCGAGWEHNPPTEVWMWGAALCQGMEGERQEAKGRKIPLLLPQGLAQAAE